MLNKYKIGSVDVCVDQTINIHSISENKSESVSSESEKLFREITTRYKIVTRVKDLFLNQNTVTQAKYVLGYYLNCAGLICWCIEEVL